MVAALLSPSCTVEIATDGVLMRLVGRVGVELKSQLSRFGLLEFCRLPSPSCRPREPAIAKFKTARSAAAAVQASADGTLVLDGETLKVQLVASDGDSKGSSERLQAPAADEALGQKVEAAPARVGQPEEVDGSIGAATSDSPAKPVGLSETAVTDPVEGATARPDDFKVAAIVGKEPKDGASRGFAAGNPEGKAEEEERTSSGIQPATGLAASQQGAEHVPKLQPDSSYWLEGRGSSGWKHWANALEWASRWSAERRLQRAALAQSDSRRANAAGCKDLIDPAVPAKASWGEVEEQLAAFADEHGLDDKCRSWLRTRPRAVLLQVMCEDLQKQAGSSSSTSAAVVKCTGTVTGLLWDRGGYGLLEDFIQRLRLDAVTSSRLRVCPGAVQLNVLRSNWGEGPEDKNAAVAEYINNLECQIGLGIGSGSRGEVRGESPAAGSWGRSRSPRSRGRRGGRCNVHGGPPPRRYLPDRGGHHGPQARSRIPCRTASPLDGRCSSSFPLGGIGRNSKGQSSPSTVHAPSGRFCGTVKSISRDHCFIRCEETAKLCGGKDVLLRYAKNPAVRALPRGTTVEFSVQNKFERGRRPEAIEVLEYKGDAAPGAVVGDQAPKASARGGCRKLEGFVRAHSLERAAEDALRNLPPSQQAKVLRDCSQVSTSVTKRWSMSKLVLSRIEALEQPPEQERATGKKKTKLHCQGRVAGGQERHRSSSRYSGSGCRIRLRSSASVAADKHQSSDSNADNPPPSVAKVAHLRERLGTGSPSSRCIHGGSGHGSNGACPSSSENGDGTPAATGAQLSATAAAAGTGPSALAAAAADPTAVATAGTVPPQPAGQATPDMGLRDSAPATGAAGRGSPVPGGVKFKLSPRCVPADPIPELRNPDAVAGVPEPAAASAGSHASFAAVAGSKLAKRVVNAPGAHWDASTAPDATGPGSKLSAPPPVAKSSARRSHAHEAGSEGKHAEPGEAKLYAGAMPPASPAQGPASLALTKVPSVTKRAAVLEIQDLTNTPIMAKPDPGRLLAKFFSPTLAILADNDPSKPPVVRSWVVPESGSVRMEMQNTELCRSAVRVLDGLKLFDRSIKVVAVGEDRSVGALAT